MNQQLSPKVQLWRITDDYFGSSKQTKLPITKDYRFDSQKLKKINCVVQYFIERLYKPYNC